MLFKALLTVPLAASFVLGAAFPEPTGDAKRGFNPISIIDSGVGDATSAIGNGLGDATSAVDNGLGDALSFATSVAADGATVISVGAGSVYTLASNGVGFVTTVGSSVFTIASSAATGLANGHGNAASALRVPEFGLPFAVALGSMFLGARLVL